MATLTKEQVEQKLQQLQQLAEQVSALTKELAEAGAIELSEEELENVSGGKEYYKIETVGSPSSGRYSADKRVVVKIPIPGTGEIGIPGDIPEPEM